MKYTQEENICKRVLKVRNMKKFNTYSISDEHEGLTVEEYLKKILAYSGRKIQKLIRQKGILLNKKSVYLQKKVTSGDLLRVLIFEDQSYGVLAETGIIDILYEDADIIILNKPTNMLVHPTGQTFEGTLANYLAGYFQQSGEVLTIRPLHRLDRDTTGCILFAKNAQTQSLLEQQLHNGDFKRCYYALVNGNIEPPCGTINHPIGKHLSKPNRRAVNPAGEQAVTHYKMIKSFQDMSLLELNLETGKTHQIRVHLAHIGHPIIGDRMYGKSSPLITRQALHAKKISFIHPTDKKEITVHSPFPRDMERMIECDQSKEPQSQS